MHEKGGNPWKTQLREMLQHGQEIHGKSQVQLQVMYDPDTAVFSLSLGFISLILMLGCVSQSFYQN